MSSPQMIRMFGFLSELLAAGLDCFVCAIEVGVDPVKKNAAINAAIEKTFRFGALEFMRDFLSWLISNGLHVGGPAKKQ